MIRIRKIEAKDDKAMEEIIKEALESVGLDIPGTAYFDPQIKHLSAFYKPQANANYWVLENEEKEVVGGAGIGPFGEEEEVGELQKLYISSKAQGFGFSKKLMNVALEFAAAHYDYCYIETSHKLEVANQLYSKLGFRELEKPLDGSEHGTMDKWYIKKL